ncbi:hypothetical protein N0V90_003458 [Kalmusia sp. IMI 367209]|nr:hypothetical protein N0V90_003458 [Kalmusia sp. IMI 367209]
MSAPAFGFSVGDIIAGIKLIKDLIESLDDAVGARPHYRRLIDEMRNLEQALTEVKNLRIDAQSQACQKIALEQAALQCQACIEAFLKKNAKFQPALGLQPTASTWRTNLRKIQWAVCRQDAVDKFRAEIAGHVLTINTLLATTQLAFTTFQADRTTQYHEASEAHHQEGHEARTLVKKNNEILNTQADLILTISRTVAHCSTQQQSKNLSEIMLKVLETNMKIYQLVLDTQKVQQAHMPQQIDRQQPIYFEDAHGRLSAFHIEFINCFEAFQAVMEIRFRHVPGLKKIQKNQYLIQEPSTKRRLNLQGPWESVFLPGRKVVMSMVFQTPQVTMTSCPGCQSENEVATDASQAQIQCSNPDCGIWYQRISEVDEVRDKQGEAKTTLGKRRRRDDLDSPAKRKTLGFRDEQPLSAHDYDGLSDDSDDEEDTVRQFRRVHVIHRRHRKSHQTEVASHQFDNASILPVPAPYTVPHLSLEHQDRLPPESLVPLPQVDNLRNFLISAPIEWNPDQYIRRFLLPTGEYVSCVLWNNIFHISGTDVIRCLNFRFQAFGRTIRHHKQFETEIFSELRSFKTGFDATTEESRSPFLDFLYRNNCVRTMGKQKVFY